MKPDKTVEVRNVTIPVTQGNLSEVASGVSPNELVVTDGQDKLQQGSRVEPHTQGSGTQSAEGTSTDQNAANASPNSNSGQGQSGRRGKNGNQRGTASQ
jgi:multidrug efflux system membrane fusion protein